AFNGLDPAGSGGVWTLEIDDVASSDVGVLSDWSLTFTTATPLPHQNFPSTDVPQDIPPGAPTSTTGTTISTLTIPANPFTDGWVVSDINVNVTLTHSFDGDLILTLISPSGRRVVLANRIGGSFDNYTSTTFDDSSTTPIGNTPAPHTGTFRPDEFLA